MSRPLFCWLLWWTIAQFEKGLGAGDFRSCWSLPQMFCRKRCLLGLLHASVSSFCLPGRKPTQETHTHTCARVGWGSRPIMGLKKVKQDWALQRWDKGSVPTVWGASFSHDLRGLRFSLNGCRSWFHILPAQPQCPIPTDVPSLPLFGFPGGSSVWLSPRGHLLGPGLWWWLRVGHG